MGKTRRKGSDSLKGERGKTKPKEEKPKRFFYSNNSKVCLFCGDTATKTDRAGRHVCDECGVM